MLDHVQLRPLAPTFGVEVTGLDSRLPLTDEACEFLVRLIAERSLLLFRAPGMTVDEHVAFTERIGRLVRPTELNWTPPEQPDADPARLGNPNGYPVVNRGDVLYFVNGPGLSEAGQDRHSNWDTEDSEIGKGASAWHTAETEKYDVELLNLLYAEVPSTHGGVTHYCDTTAAFEALDPGMRERLSKMRAVHFYTTPHPTEPVSQALVKEHAITGRLFLYFNYYTIDRIEGLPRAESDTLLKQLLLHQVAPPFRYTHHWQEGDLIVWNCNGTMHRRGPLATGERRVMRRTQAQVPSLASRRPWDKTIPARPEVAHSD